MSANPHPKMKSVDPRIQRTRASLQDAVITLCKKRDPSEVSVSEVAETAGVNRTTFYQHYTDVDTLLADAIDSITEAAHAQLDFAGSGGETDPRDVVANYLTHVHDNARLYRAVLGSNGSSRSPVLLARLTQRITMIAEQGIRASDVADLRMPAAIQAASVAGSFVGILNAWLEMKPLPPAETATEWMLAALGLESLNTSTTR